MSALTAAVAIVGALCVLNLLLTFGVVRRLREHTSILNTGALENRPVIGLPIGDRPSPFTSVTIAGEQVSDSTPFQVVAFFEASCSTCPERVLPFIQYLGEHHLPRQRVLAVVGNADSDPVPYLNRLAEVALVCEGPDTARIITAYRVRGFPAFCVLDADGRLVASNYDPGSLPQPVAL
jgi:hypothetical protein